MSRAPLFGLLLLGSIAHAGEVGLDLNDDVAHLGFSGQPNPQALGFTADLYHNEDDADLYTGGVQVRDKMSEFRDIEFSLGGLVGHLDGDQLDGSFIGLSLRGTFHSPDLVGMSMTLGIDAAPDVVSSADIGGYQHLLAEAAWQIIPSGQVYGGYRHIDIDVERGRDFTFDDSIYAGFRFLF